MPLRLLLAALAAFVIVAGPAGAKATWTPYSAPIDGFTISFPGAPKVASAPETGTVDGTYRTYSTDLTTTAYFVSVMHFLAASAPAANDITYRKLLDSYAGGSKCAIKSTRDLTIAGQPALEAICLNAKSKTDHVVDAVMSGDFLYVIVSAGPKGYAQGPTAKIFRDSFSLQPASTPAPPAPSASPAE